MRTLINFSHPLSRRQRMEAEEELGMSIREISISCSLDMEMPLAPQTNAIVSSVPLTDDQWQSLDVIVQLPGLGIGSALILVALLAKLGSYPLVLRQRKAGQGKRGVYEFGELIDLQGVYQANFPADMPAWTRFQEE